MGDQNRDQAKSNSLLLTKNLPIVFDCVASSYFILESKLSQLAELCMHAGPLYMYNSEHKGHHNHHPHHCAPMSPRISFSNDFVDVQQAMKHQEQRGSRSDPALSSDFEFSVSNYSMMSADELFFKGRLLPYKDNCNNNNNNNQMQRATTTLKEELLINDDHEYEDFSLRPPKGSSTRWKGLLGLRKSHIGSKKVDKSEGPSDRGVEPRRSALLNEGAPINMTSSQLLNEGGTSCRDLEIGI
ncbi:hypothetical protein VNO77_40850 [Canavalia gladiata]|uniref:Uncharacterized protein n=1 Tax=Canavalia gladiata TaxID=3824 RepID=A0AAN9JYC6_CANGL